MRRLAPIVLLLALALPVRGDQTTYSGPVESHNGFTVNGVPVCLSDGTNCICVCTTTTVPPTTTTAVPTTTVTTTSTTTTTT